MSLSRRFLLATFLTSCAVANATTLSIALFLARAGSAQLPLFYLIFALGSPVIGTLVARALDTIGTEGVLSSLLAILTIVSVTAFFLPEVSAPTALVGYVIATLIELHALSANAILLRENFPFAAGRRLTGRFSVMLAFGGIVGSLIVTSATAFLTPPSMFAITAVLSIAAIASVRRFIAGAVFSPNIPAESHNDYQESRGAFREAIQVYRRHPLARLLTLGVVLAVFVQSLQGIIGFAIFDTYFEQDLALTRFLGAAVAVQHVAGLILAVVIAGAGLQKIGLIATHLFYPLLQYATFLTVFGFSGLVSGVLARVAAEPLDNNVNTPLILQFYNALPGREGRRQIVFENGTIFPVSLGVAGIVLLALQIHGISATQLAIIGMAICVPLAIVHFATGRVYHRVVRSRVAQESLTLQAQRSDTTALPALYRRILSLPAEQVAGALEEHEEELARLRSRTLELLLRCLPHERDRIRTLLARWYAREWARPVKHAIRARRRASSLPDSRLRRAVDRVIEDLLRRARSILIELLRPLDPEDHLGTVEARLRAGAPLERAEAIERLSLLPDRRLTRWIPLVFGDAYEDTSNPEPATQSKAIATNIRRVQRTERRVRAALEKSHERWNRCLIEQWNELASDTVSDYADAPHMERLNLLHEIPLLSELDLDDLQELSRQLEVRRVKRGDVLFREGEQPDGLYIVLDGTINISRATDKGNQRLVARLENGQPVGEMALLDELPRSATATAACDTQLLRLSILGFHTLVMQRPSILLSMCKVLAARLRP